jgi:glycosyltransferase involved in cell wall biosynthesis
MTISIVTVVLNAEKTIADALGSVASQTYRRVEHLLIDGGSTDATLPIVRQCGKHLSALISEPDEGLYHAMNKGAKFATGEVLGFLNADDFYAHPEILERVTGVFRDATIDVCFGDLQYVDRHNPQLVLRHWEAGAFTPGRFASGWAPPHPSFFVRRHVFDAAGGFNTNYKLAADNDLMMRILECRGHKSRYLSEVMVKMRVGGETNKNLKNIIQGNREILNALSANGLKTNPFRYLFRKIWLKAGHRLGGLRRRGKEPEAIRK